MFIYSKLFISAVVVHSACQLYLSPNSIISCSEPSKSLVQIPEKQIPGLTSDSALNFELLFELGGKLRQFFNFWDQKVDLFLLPFISLTAAVSGGDLSCRVFT